MLYRSWHFYADYDYTRFGDPATQPHGAFSRHQHFDLICMRDAQTSFTHVFLDPLDPTHTAHCACADFTLVS
jgi:hypothetical protein